MQQLKEKEGLESVEFFIQCHETPYYSYMHRNIYMSFPDCSSRQLKRPEEIESYQVEHDTLNVGDGLLKWVVRQAEAGSEESEPHRDLRLPGEEGGSVGVPGGSRVQEGKEGWT